MLQQTTVPVVDHHARFSPVRKHVARSVAAIVQTEQDAAELMWAYYKDRKPLFITDIRLHRASIIAALMAGVPPVAAFEPYLKSACQVVPVARPRHRRAA